jgi:hypothetical protein
MYKVPFRDVMSDTLFGWFLMTLWCHAVIRIFPGAYDYGSQQEMWHGLSQMRCPGTQCCNAVINERCPLSGLYSCPAGVVR